jgi:hypothetical protein
VSSTTKSATTLQFSTTGVAARIPVGKEKPPVVLPRPQDSPPVVLPRRSRKAAVVVTAPSTPASSSVADAPSADLEEELEAAQEKIEEELGAGLQLAFQSPLAAMSYAAEGLLDYIGDVFDWIGGLFQDVGKFFHDLGNPPKKKFPVPDIMPGDNNALGSSVTPAEPAQQQVAGQE